MRDLLAHHALATGFPVFPCASDKRPIVKNGFKAASLDRDEIIAMFASPDAALIGLPTGHRSGLLVVDVDVSNGKRGAEWFEENRECFPETRIHRTRSGGMHLIFQMPKSDIRNSASKLAPDVDVRGNGGYVIWPPSPGYTVSVGLPPAEAPAWLVNRLLPPKRTLPPKPICEAGNEQARRALIRAVDCIARSMQGGRNDQLNRQAFILGMYVGAGLLDLSDVTGNLFHAAKSAGLTDQEIKASIRSGLTAGRTASPRA